MLAGSANKKRQPDLSVLQPPVARKMCCMRATLLTKIHTAQAEHLKPLALTPVAVIFPILVQVDQAAKCDPASPENRKTQRRH